MVRLSLRVAASAMLQKRERMKLRRRRATQRTENRVAPQIRIGRAMQGSITWVAPEIPLDILIEILTRLPAKSVLRFKCVSKFWSSLLSSRYFCNRFLSVPSQPRLYMSLLDLYHNSKSLLLSSAPSTCPSSSSSLVFDQDLTIRKMGGFFLRVLRGFICSTVDLKPHIYNPTTRQLVILPAIQGYDILAAEDRYDILYFMGHDPVNDQFKLLCTITSMSNNDMQKIKSERWVLVVEAGGSWKRVAKESPPHLPNPFELNMNGFLYYLAWTHMYTCVLVSFDMRSEEFNMMVQVPRKAGDEMVPRVKKMVIQVDYGGKVAVFDYTYILKSGTVDLWVLQDGRKEEWSRKTMVLQPSQLHLLNGNHRLIPKGTTLKDKVVLVPPNLVAPFYFLCYDL
ncbi:PREDICTED: F-box only protein 8-like [Camelina sativa]|uniref:F-box only protein 8-like n=1 Tax=Camelina sativa TaxID=90675 RepID=A0ABM0W8Y4_CAMSA|nr:PREDICTED: F-box only protein 8-like [Camelina sativa]